VCKTGNEIQKFANLRREIPSDEGDQTVAREMKIRRKRGGGRGRRRVVTEKDGTIVR